MQDKRLVLPVVSLLVVSLLPVSIEAATKVGSANGVVLTAALTTDSVTHKLFQPTDTKVPQPFYKKFCSKEKSVAYNDAQGIATLWYNPTRKVLMFAFSYSGLSGSPIMIHFHWGASGKGGPIVQTICGNPPPNNPKLGYSAAALVGRTCPLGTSGFIMGSYKLKGNSALKPMLAASQEVNALIKRNLYINIHTCLNELGELRGQVKPLK